MFRISLQAKMCTAVCNSWKSFHIRKTRASENQFFMKKIDFDAKQNSCFVFDMQCPTGNTTNEKHFMRNSKCQETPVCWEVVIQIMVLIII